MSIRARLIAVVSLLVSLPAGIVALNVTHARRLAGDAVMVDYSGSERMRAFMTAGLVALYMRRPAPEVRARIEEELALWERVRQGLRDGDESLGLKGTADPTLREELDRAGAYFEDYRSAVLSALAETGTAGATAKAERSNEILSGAFGLYGFMDRVTKGLQQNSEETVRSFRRAQVILAAAIGLVGVLALAGGYWYVLRPLPRFLVAM